MALILKQKKISKIDRLVELQIKEQVDELEHMESELISS